MTNIKDANKAQLDHIHFKTGPRSVMKDVRPAMKSLETELFIAGVQSSIASQKHFQKKSQTWVTVADTHKPRH